MSLQSSSLHREDAVLLDYFYRGLIPGPDEQEDEFLRRVQKAHPLQQAEWDDASKKTKDRFGFHIDWVPLSYSNHKMTWWEAAVTWLDNDSLPSIQMRKKFQKGSFLGYHRSDILAHEAIHAARMRFEEPHFEEILAYSMSPQRWKRFWGPIFTSTWEPFCFLTASLAGVVFPPILITAFLGWSGWLFLRQATFKKCYRKFSLHLVLCLTDREIWRAAWSSKPLAWKASTLREKLLYTLHQQQS